MDSWFSVLDDTDEETARLIVRLQLEDIETLARTGSVDSDGSVAARTYQAELHSYRAIRGAHDGDEPTATDHDAFTTPISPATDPVIPERDIPTFACVVCDERFDTEHCWQAPCQHFYCDEHLEELFRVSLQDRTLYPPRCCRQNMPYEDVRAFLSPILTRQFEAKKPELDDVRPTYCCMPTCSTYIGEGSKEGNEGTCPECSIKTCVICKQVIHAGDCEDDNATKETLELAKSEGWQKCPRCERMVELRSGCNHMTCLCRAEFCYVCGLAWKTCTCPQFEEERLLERGQAIVEREGRGDVQNVIDNLRCNHECVEHEWEFVREGNTCDECGDYLGTFIFRCENCRMLACRRCRDNRL